MNGVKPLPAAIAPSRLQHEVAAEEAGKAAQRYLDLCHELERTSIDRDEWRRHAQAADAEIERLEAREEELTKELEHTRLTLTHDRDLFRNRLVKLVAQFEAAGQIILRCMSTAQEHAPEVDLHSLASKIVETDTAAKVEPPKDLQPGDLPEDGTDGRE
jgi:hypothetical protein